MSCHFCYHFLSSFLSIFIIFKKFPIKGPESASHPCTKTKIMAYQGYRVVLPGLLVFVGLLIGNSIAATPSHRTASLNRSSFPAGFIFGTAAASYQVSPAWVSSMFVSYIYNTVFLHVFWDVPMFVCLKSSMKVLQMKVAEDQVYGILTPIDIQVSLSLSFSVEN